MIDFLRADGSARQDCPECPIAMGNRRLFLRDMGLAVAAALMATGLSPSRALAALVAEIRPVNRRGPFVSYAAPKSEAVLVDSDNEVIIARAGRNVYAFSMRCPHKGAKLEWIEAESKIFCPRHKARFSASGDHLSGRRSRNLDRHALQLQGGLIVVDTETVYREDQHVTQWQKALITI
ncbi:MAG TPA: Rieske (2Fe-2S) protein [Gemmatimonadaceae bacterium]